VTVKHQSPSVRWTELKGDYFLGVGVDPGLRHMALAAVVVKNVPKGKGLQRVHDLNKNWSIAGLQLFRVPDEEGGYGTERPVVAMADKIQEALSTFTVSSTHVGAPGRLWVQGTLAVEGQHVSAGTTPDPRRILDLANVAGSALGTPMLPRENWQKLRPLPHEWKGEQPKFQNQSNTWRKFGIRCESSGGKEPYAIPQGMGKHPFNKADWKDLGDALGLAVFAIETTWPF
jgi:hypothetical protein